MNPEELLAAIQKVAEEMKTSVAAHCSALEAKYTALADSIDKMKKADEAGSRSGENEDDMGPGGARLTAADRAERRADGLQSDLRQLHHRVNALDSHSKQNQATRDQFADLQAKADVAYRAWCEGAPPPMSGEGVLDYAIRLHRPLMKHSKKFAKADLLAMARDPATLNTICDSIRADAVEASMNPVDMPKFQHREIKSESPGGHKITSFVGNGTIFAQMSRPHRNVKTIGFDSRYNGIPASRGGAVIFEQ